jgi:hypothetical protein
MSQDFFSKLIATQTCGPNMRPPGEAREGGCIVMYACPTCSDEHDDEDDARECCPREPSTIYRCAICRTLHCKEEDAEGCCPSIAQHAQPMQCPICLQEADSFQVAVDCCMHVHPTMKAFGRERVALALASGISWIDAVSANTNH